VYCGLPTGGASDVVAEAFAWLVQEEVPVINVSLVGPPNRVLEGVVQRVIAGGHIVVAAVGNDGPAAPPLYPAAWPGVIGVTGVDARRHVLAEAERGPQVKFAAPGAQMAAAKRPSGYTLVRGTSFAAPIVAGLLALNLPAPDTGAADRAVEALAREAVDLGNPGPDPVYGFGLVGETLRRQPVLTTLRVN
jgi:subtilisin family serine protease